MINVYEEYLSVHELKRGTTLKEIKNRIIKELQEQYKQKANELYKELARDIMKDYEVLKAVVEKQYKLTGCICNISNMKVRDKR